MKSATFIALETINRQLRNQQKLVAQLAQDETVNGGFALISGEFDAMLNIHTAMERTQELLSTFLNNTDGFSDGLTPEQINQNKIQNSVKGE